MLDFEIPPQKKDIIKGFVLPKELSNELAYLCGIITGDGSIYCRINKKEYTVKCVGNPLDEKELYHQIIGPFFSKIFGLRPCIKYQDSKTTYGFIIYSKTLFIFFTEVMGLPSGKKYSGLKIPTIFGDDEQLLIHFIRGLFDTDGCISFKKKYKDKPYYPVISLSSKSQKLIEEIAIILKKWGFKVVESYNYQMRDIRVKQGHTIINRLELNGKENLRNWLLKINFYSPKHLNKIKKIMGSDSGERI